MSSLLKLNYRELQLKAKNMNIKAIGKKDVLLKRIQSAINKKDIASLIQSMNLIITKDKDKNYKDCLMKLKKDIVDDAVSKGEKRYKANQLRKSQLCRKLYPIQKNTISKRSKSRSTRSKNRSKSRRSNKDENKSRVVPKCINKITDYFKNNLTVLKYKLKELENCPTINLTLNEGKKIIQSSNDKFFNYDNKYKLQCYINQLLYKLRREYIHNDEGLHVLKKIIESYFKPLTKIGTSSAHGIAYIVHFMNDIRYAFSVLKISKGQDLNYPDLLHEITTGLILNELRKDGINSFMYCFGGFYCNKKQDNKVKCTTDNPNNLTILALFEYIPNAHILSDLILKNKLSFTQAIDCMIMVWVVLFIAQQKYKFVHYDLHSNNVLFVNIPCKQTIIINNKNYTFKSLYTPVIIDYGMASLTYNNQFIPSFFNSNNINIKPETITDLTGRNNYFTPIYDIWRYTTNIIADIGFKNFEIGQLYYAELMSYFYNNNFIEINSTDKLLLRLLNYKYNGLDHLLKYEIEISRDLPIDSNPWLFSFNINNLFTL